MEIDSFPTRSALGGSTRQLVLGTSNRKKGAELAELLAPLPVELKMLTEFPERVEVAEEGDSFAANARLKATVQARHLTQWVLGEDSGLVVDALAGAPGIRSARYAGPGATDEANNRRLLDELSGIPLEKRTAHYVCHVVLADPRGELRAESQAACHGRIVLAPAGSAGFGYDPLFEIVEYHRTFGQMGGAVKGLISHRSRAVRELVPQITRVMRSGEKGADGKRCIWCDTELE